MKKQIHVRIYNQGQTVASAEFNDDWKGMGEARALIFCEVGKLKQQAQQHLISSLIPAGVDKDVVMGKVQALADSFGDVEYEAIYGLDGDEYQAVVNDVVVYFGIK